MSAWLHSLPVGWMAVLVFAATYAACAALHSMARALLRTESGREARTVTPALLSPLGVTFGLLIVFTGAQVWGDVDRATAAVNQEASALRTTVLLAGVFPESSAAHLRSLVARQIDEEVTVEWPAMAHNRATLTAIPTALAGALMAAAALEPSRPGQVAAQREIVVALTGALEARRLRILASHKQVNGLKWWASSCRRSARSGRSPWCTRTTARRPSRDWACSARPWRSACCCFWRTTSRSSATIPSRRRRSSTFGRAEPA